MSLIFIAIFIVALCLFIKLRPKSKSELFTPNEEYYGQIFAPLEYNYGYSNIDDPMFTAHPVKMIDANYPDKLIKHVRLNHTGSPMYWTYNPPNSNILNKVTCPYSVVDVTNKNHLNSRYNLVCWSK